MQTYHYDLRGSTIALTDAKGNVTDTYTYDTYGEELSHEGNTNQPFQYDGRDGVQTDPNGLYQMRSRYYNPEIRRFVNRDVVTGTIADGLTMNRYAYVNGNPVSYVDPFGLSAEHSDLMRTGFSMALDAVPFVGTVKGMQEVLTGVDLITGQHLSVADRVAEGAGTLLSFFPDGKLLGTFAAKEAIDGGEWAWKQVGKEADKLTEETGNLQKNVDPWRDDFGKPSDGYGQLVKDLPKWDPMRNKFAQMIKEVREVGTVRRDLNDPKFFAAFGGESIESGIWFRYNPNNLRSVDMLEEVIHWQQYKKGLHSSGYSDEALELMAKRSIINNYNISPELKKELLHDIQRVLDGSYTNPS